MGMASIRQAKRRIAEAEDKARTIIRTARINLGLVILNEEAKGVQQKEIAEELGLSREQIRRITREAEKAVLNVGKEKQ